jgi:alpha-tubulin suppressor-like RCC1 family protein
LTPVAVSSLTGATAVSAGGDSACALLPGGTVQCWGGNAYGALGNGAAGDYSATPVPVSGLSGAAAISVGSSSACAVLSGGTVECWGSNAVGELGDGTTIDSATPVVVSGLMNASSVSVGGSPANGQYSACAVISDGSVRCWGNTTFGALGNGTAIGPDTCCSAEEPDDAGCAFGFSVPCSPAPVAVSGLTGATAVSMASSFACALLSGGTVQCWGENDLGELGTGTYGPDSCCGVTIPDGGCLNALQACSWTPATVTGVVGATAISAQGNACALLSGGTVQCWGGNDNGQLGNGSTNGFSLTPVAVQ